MSILRLSIVTILLICVFLAGGVILFCLMGAKRTCVLSDITRGRCEQALVPVSNKKQVKKIAILTPITHVTLEKIQAGFCERLSKSTGVSYDIRVFNGNGDDVLLLAQAHEIVAGEFDLVFTIGAHATRLMKQVFVKNKSKIPLVFGAVARPRELGIIPSHDSRDVLCENITGVSEEIDHHLQLELLLKLKPGIKHVLLLYNPTQGAGLDVNKQVIVQHLLTKNINTQCVEIYKTSEVCDRASVFIDQSDALLVLTDNTVIPALDGLVQLCNKHHVLLCASDLDSVSRGAGFGFGVNAHTQGETCAQIVIKILENNYLPAKIPVRPSDDFRVMINRKTCLQQGLSIDPLLCFFMSSSCFC